MISGVSNNSNVAFRATASDKLTPEMVNYPGNYSAEGDKVDISQKPKKKNSFAKFLGTVAALAVATGVALGIAVKKGKLAAPAEDATGFMSKVQKYAHGFGDWCQTQWSKLFSKSEKVVENADNEL